MSGILKYTLLSSLAVCAVVSSAYAIKFDGVNPPTTVMETVGKVQGVASDTMKQVEHVKTYMTMLDGLKEGLNKIKDIKNQLESSVGGLVASVGDAVSQAQSLQNSLSPAQDLINIQKEQASAKAECDAQISDLENKRDAETQKYKDNIDVLQKYINEHPDEKDTHQPKIDANNKKIEEIKSKYQKLIDDKRKAFENTDKKYTQQISALQSSMSNVDPLSNINAGSAMKKVSGMFGGDSGGAMNEVIAKYFYAQNEEPSTKRNGEINNARRDMALQDAAEVYAEAVKVMSAGDKELIMVKDLQTEGQATETEDSGITLDLSVKVANTRALLKYARLLVAEVKMTTSQNLINLPKKLNNYNKDVTQFNLDDYEYKEKQKSTLDTLNDYKNQATAAIEAGKQAAGEAMATAGSAINAATEAAGTAMSTATSATSAMTETVGSATGMVNDASSMAGDAMSMVR